MFSNAFVLPGAPAGLVARINARTHGATEQLDTLAASIRAQGVLQPLLVRRQGGKYELVAGERRLRAARQAGLTAVPQPAEAAFAPQRRRGPSPQRR